MSSAKNSNDDCDVLTSDKPTSKKEDLRSPFKDIFTEEDLQVKIADLGNACMTVNDFTYLNKFYIPIFR